MTEYLFVGAIVVFNECGGGDVVGWLRNVVG